MTGGGSGEVVRWMLMERSPEPSLIVLVVDDSADDELVSIIAHATTVPSDDFGGVWGSGQRDGIWLVAFQLVQFGGGVERQWFTDNIHRELLEAILTVPHLVAILPAEIAADARTAEDLVPRLGSALIVKVEHHSPQVQQILDERDD